MSAASKARWRANNTERRREAERQRAALRRRHGRFSFVGGQPAVVFSYPSGESYQRYERGGYDIPQGGFIGRSAQRWRYYLKVILPARRAATRMKLAAMIEEMTAPTGVPALDAFYRDLAAKIQAR